MQNKDKYKTPQERVKAFNEYCSLHSCECCELDKYDDPDYEAFPNALNCSCTFYWLELDDEAPSTPQWKDNLTSKFTRKD